MTKFLQKSFSVAVGGKDYSDGWERIFGKKKDEKARLDEDRAAKPKTELLARVVTGNEGTSFAGTSFAGPAQAIRDVETGEETPLAASAEHGEEPGSDG